MVLLNEQIKMINRLFPIRFSEDEFRLEESLTHKRIYGRLNEIDDNELLEVYYNIYLNYLELFEDAKNVYLNLIYKILLEVFQNNNIEYEKFIFKQKVGVYNVNVISAIIGAAFVLFFRNFKILNTILFFMNLFIIIKWDKWVKIWSKHLKVKTFKVREMKAAHMIFMISNIMVSILQLRDSKSILFLVLGYIFTIICHIISMNKINNSKYMLKIVNSHKKVFIKLYEYLVLIFLIWSLINPACDLIGYHFGGDNIKYFEGICSESKKQLFGFSKTLINDIEVLTYSEKIKVGNYYTIVYGEKTGVILEIKEVNITE